MIKRADYFRYHKLLKMGVVDDELLDRMIENALETGYQILLNSQHVLNPEQGHICPQCGCIAAWDYAGNWHCTCGWHESWDNLYEGREDYTEQTGKLANYLGNLEHADRETRGVWFEILLQFMHGSGPMARFYIQGGWLTISEFRTEEEIHKRMNIEYGFKFPYYG